MVGCFFGGLAHAYPMSLNRAEQKLCSQIEERYPQLAGIGIEKVWGGTLAFSLHSCPIICRVGDDGPWFASAFAGHGIVPTCVAGELIASGIASGDERWRMLQRNLPPSLSFCPFSRLGAELMLRFFQGMGRLMLMGIAGPCIAVARSSDDQPPIIGC